MFVIALGTVEMARSADPHHSLGTTTVPDPRVRYWFYTLRTVGAGEWQQQVASPAERIGLGSSKGCFMLLRQTPPLAVGGVRSVTH